MNSARILAAIITLFISVFPTAAVAQSRVPEVFGSIGVFRAASDDGDIGDPAVSFGGTIGVPIGERVSVGLDLQTSKISVIRSGNDFYKTRRTLLLPHMLYRWGTSRAYFFLGSAAGADFTKSVTRDDSFRAGFRPNDWREVRPGVFELEYGDTRRILWGPKLGLAVFPTERLGIRFDLYCANWHMGARIGAGCRF